MTTEEILQGNEDIDVFNDNALHKRGFSISEMNYHKDWNSLMPVVTSCKLKGLDIEMRGFNVRVYRPYIKIYNCPEKEFDTVDREKYITPVFIAVTDFITWLNQQPKQN